MNGVGAMVDDHRQDIDDEFRRLQEHGAGKPRAEAIRLAEDVSMVAIGGCHPPLRCQLQSRRGHGPSGLSVGVAKAHWVPGSRIPAEEMRVKPWRVHAPEYLLGECRQCYLPNIRFAAWRAMVF